MAPHPRFAVRGLAVSTALALVLAGTALPAQAAGEVEVDTRYKSSVARAYKDVLVPALATPTGWSGSTSPCSPGSESGASRAATLKAINFMRGMNQLSPVRLDGTGNARATRTALLMDANDRVSHYPTRSSFRRCWSSTASDVASRSNLALSLGGSTGKAPTTGARSVVAYMKDAGASNVAVGHRRWLLNPTTRVMATGSTSSANALVVTGYTKSSTAKKPRYIEWPSQGWFPQQLEPGGRWSLSTSSNIYNFKNAKVKVVKTTSSGKWIKTLPTKRYTPKTGMGPKTFVFDVSGVDRPTGKATAYYRVTVSGIIKYGKTKVTRSYTVKLFDPTGS